MRERSMMPYVLGTGGLIGGAIITWLGPRTITWWYTPPKQIGFDCAAPIESALVNLQWAQAGGIVVGAFIAFLFYLKFRRRNGTSVQTENY